MRYTRCSKWKELVRRFPCYSMEEKLAQFSHLNFKGRQIPMVSNRCIPMTRQLMISNDDCNLLKWFYVYASQELENFLKRALDVEQQDATEKSGCLTVEGQKGVHLFKPVDGDEDLAVGLMMARGLSSLITPLIKRIVPDFKGFALTIVSLSASYLFGIWLHFLITSCDWRNRWYIGLNLQFCRICYVDNGNSYFETFLHNVNMLIVVFVKVASRKCCSQRNADTCLVAAQVCMTNFLNSLYLIKS